MATKNGNLLFIDTNILLDFYRVRKDAGLSLLNRIDDLHQVTITSCQVEMEFKKNRQKVIHESLLSLKAPDVSITPPAFLSETKTVELMKKRLNETRTRITKLKQRISRNLDRPSMYDPVYKVAQRLFGYTSPYNLKKGTDDYRAIYRLAWKRFIEGYPPRKRDDTSIGDALNWEWIIRCAERSGLDIVIVSRDADYAMTYDDVSYVNDWLLQEFKTRLSQKRKLHIADRLSTALKMMSVAVTAEEAQEEKEALATSKPEDQTVMWQTLIEDLLKRRRKVQETEGVKDAG